MRRLRNSGRGGRSDAGRLCADAPQARSRPGNPNGSRAGSSGLAIRLSINRAVRRPHETTQAPETFDAFRTRPDVPIDGLVRQEQAREVKKGLSRLRKLDRETLVAFYFEGQSLKEMSDRFSSPVGTIKRRLHTARARLKDALGELQPA